MKRFVIFLLIFFLGFFTHALFFPDVMYDGFHNYQKLIENKAPTPTPDNHSEDGTIEFFTYVNYTGTNFDKRNVKIKLGNYLAVTNISREEGMLLESDNPVFNTGRPYGYSERVQTRMDIAGTYHIINKLNPQATITVYVK